MIHTALSKPLPNSAGLYSTDGRWSMTAPTGSRMAQWWQQCNRWGRVAWYWPHLIPSLLYNYPWLLRCLLRSPGPSSLSTTDSRPTKTPTTGGYNLTFPRGHPCRTEWRAWAEATHVDPARGEKRFKYMWMKTACKWADEQTFKDQLYSLGTTAWMVKRVYSMLNVAENN